MPIFKTTQYIFNNPWGVELDNIIPVSNSYLPPKTNWSANEPPTIKDIKTWEQLYYKSGEVGIYAAWNPYTDFYIIVHNLFINTPFGVEIFHGINAADNVWNRAKELGIELPTSDLPPS